jgi:flavin-dependent dehydrogenase
MMQLSFVESNYALVSEVDVLVVGGGTAGAVAGIASARESVTTMIVEQSGFLGGTQTGALVTPMMPNQIDGKPLNRGLDWEINSRLVELSESGTWSDGNRGWFNP